jgi:hypothetical protein
MKQAVGGAAGAGAAPVSADAERLNLNGKMCAKMCSY